MMKSRSVAPLVVALGTVTTLACSGGANSENVNVGVAQANLAGGDKDARCKHFYDGHGEDADHIHEGVKHIQNLQTFDDPTGSLATYTSAPILDDDDDDNSLGRLDTSNPFFKPLGTNGRACSSCHTAENAWGVSAASVRARFESSCGTDPIFRPSDGANTPTADVSTLDARRDAYSLLLNKGLIRIEVPIPSNAQFELIGIDDPYHNDTANNTKISVYRRPLPTTNLKFTPRIMWDGREPDLATQATNATLIHGQTSTPPSADDLASIVNFETSLFTTQVRSNTAGSTSDGGATGDPISLFNTPFVLNGNPTILIPVSGPPNVVNFLKTDGFTLFDAWQTPTTPPNASREQIARGETIFNTAQLVVAQAFIPPVVHVTIKATCTMCHNAVNAGGFTAPQGSSNSSGGTRIGPRGGFNENRVAFSEFRTPDLPLYTFRDKTTHAIVQVTDPGMGVFTGLTADVGRFKAPNLRALSGRAPYFHNGMAATLRDVVEHYNTVMLMNLSEDDKAALTAFLETL